MARTRTSTTSRRSASKKTATTRKTSGARKTSSARKTTAARSTSRGPSSRSGSSRTAAAAKRTSATAKRTGATAKRRTATASTRRAPQVDAIRLLKDDHRTVKELFRRYKQLGEKATKTKQAVVEKVVRELSIHAAIEEEFLYPTIRQALPEEGLKLATEGLEEHRAAKRLLSDIDGAMPEGPEFEGRFKLLMEDVLHHMKEEEGELFPKLRSSVDREGLVRLGQIMKTAKKAAPTRPHPLAPDTPPANIVANVGAAVVDRARDAARALLGK